MGVEMLRIFRAVLHAPELSIVDNFFEMGGHSLTAAELVGKLNELGLAVAITDLWVCRQPQL
jgi:hypothetical protein